MLRAAGGATGLVALNVDDSTQNVDEQPCCSDEFFCPLACSPDHRAWASRCPGGTLGWVPGSRSSKLGRKGPPVAGPLRQFPCKLCSGLCSLQVSRDETVGRESFITEGPWLTGAASGTRGMPHGPRQPSVGVQDKGLWPEAAVRLLPSPDAAPPSRTKLGSISRSNIKPQGPPPGKTKRASVHHQQNHHNA